MQVTSNIPEKTLLGDILRHCVKSGETRTEFGLRAINDPNLVSDLENGRELRRKTRERVEAAISSNEVAAE